MLLLHRLFALPPTLLAIILSSSQPVEAQQLEWPYNLPAHVKYYPEDEVLVKRNDEIRRQLQRKTPVGIRKMSGDPGEMFFLDYWHFDIDEAEIEKGGNCTSRLAELAAPLKRHSDSTLRAFIFPRFLRRGLLDTRDFECPAGSNACTSINRPNSCCETGSTCQIVEDVGLGDVGCCPENQVCGGSVSSCPADYTSCPQSPGGGCCVPGYGCSDVGCVAVSTAVVVVVPTRTSTTSTSTRTSSPPARPTTETQTETETQTQIRTQTQTQTQTETMTYVPPPPPTTTTQTETNPTTITSTTNAIVTTTTTTTSSDSSSSRPVNTLICSSGFRSCPASLGGGCCPTDRACGRDVCPEITSTNSFDAPARPTSNTVEATTTSTATGFTTIPGAECPTGFYACSAFYQGGCCQTGRDCQPTSCPPGNSITVVDGSSITIGAPTGSGISSANSLLTGACASGWSTCGTQVGGGCCPTGYACGTACTATGPAGQNSTVGKIAPNQGTRSVDTQRIWITMAASLSAVALGFGVFI